MISLHQEELSRSWRAALSGGGGLVFVVFKKFIGQKIRIQRT